MRFHPISELPAARRPRTGFGFDAIMANPVHGRFGRWYDATSLLAPGRAAVEGLFSSPDGADAAGRRDGVV